MYTLRPLQKRAFSSVPVWRGASAWLPVLIQSQRDRVGERGPGGEEDPPGGEAECVGGGGNMCRVLLCLIRSMSPLQAV